MKKIALGAALFLAISGAASAQGMYFGGGIANNSLDGGFDDAVGFQVFGGVPLSKVGAFNTAVEVGYTEFGDFEYTYPCFTGSFTNLGTCTAEVSPDGGIWANGVATYPFTSQAEFILRAGIDFTSDDDGFMFGAGVGYKFTPAMEIRGEYVARDNIDSLQANLIFRP